MSTAAAVALSPELPALVRLARLTPLAAGGLALLRSASERGLRTVERRRELVAQGEEIVTPMLLLSGWAARVRMLADGRRQILGFLLPGDLIGTCWQERPIAPTTVVAMTPATLCVPPRVGPNLPPGLTRLYAISKALEEALTLGHVLRLGRFSAYERVADLMLELYERLALAGLVSHTSFAMPLTQEMIADAAGLTSVHVNRTLRALRHDGVLTLQAGTVTIADPAALAATVDRRPMRVTAAPAG